jgi:hypothetical protein
MARHLPPLLTLSFLSFLAILLLLIPDEDWLPMLVYLVFVTLVAQVLYVAGIKPIDPTFPRSLFYLAFILKLVGSAIYYLILLNVYGYGDANAYHEMGRYLSEFFRRFDFSVLGSYARGVQGSASIASLTGLLYVVFPPSLSGSNFLFATLSFTGIVFFYRGFRLALPNTSPNFYRVIIFFLPSLLFWPSVLGKDAWILFGSGFVAYGLAGYARRTRLSDLLWTGTGLVIVYIARPHFAAFMILAAGIAFLGFYRINSLRRLLLWLLGAVLFIGVGTFVLQSAGQFLGLGPISEVSWGELEGFYTFRQQASTGGGGEFTTRTAFDVFGLVSAPVVVLLRPFPWEAHNPQAMVTSIESLVWLGLFWWRRRVFWARIRSIRHDPWLAFNLIYSAIMIVALTTAGNFGIIARQRAAFLPFLWVLFA